MSGPPREWRFFGDPPEPPAGDDDPGRGQAVVTPIDDLETLEAAASSSSAMRPGNTRRNPGGRSNLLAELAAQLRLTSGVALAVCGVAVVVLAVTFAVVAFGTTGSRAGAVVIADRTGTGRPPSAPTAASAAEPIGGSIVDVEGAVVAPGLRTVAAGSRVGDAIAAAGGYSSSVDLAASALALNLAAPLTDGDKIRVPSLADRINPVLASPRPDGGSSTGSGALIDLNHADEAALESLPGIGPATAAKIIAARATRPFASLEDAQSRKVLSASVVGQIRALATVTP